MSALLLAVLALGVALLAAAYSYTAYTTAKDAECARLHFEPLTADALTDDEIAATLARWKASPGPVLYLPESVLQGGNPLLQLLDVRGLVDDLTKAATLLADGARKVEELRLKAVNVLDDDALGLGVTDATNSIQYAHEDPSTGTGQPPYTAVVDPTVGAAADSAPSPRGGAVGSQGHVSCGRTYPHAPHSWQSLFHQRRCFGRAA